jgi:hypothetical protein
MIEFVIAIRHAAVEQHIGLRQASHGPKVPDGSTGVIKRNAS